jgi:phosphomannomutase
MDETPLSAEVENYCCPGEARAIDRAVHLARLAAFFAPCRQCVHRGDVRHLSPIEIRRWDEIDNRPHQPPRFTGEGFESSSPNQFDPPFARSFATSLASIAWQWHRDPSRSPCILVGSDGNWSTAELVAAICEALQLSGCQAVETGAVTSASLGVLGQQIRADAAVWIGNFSGEPHALGFKLWGKHGRPWSLPGELDVVREQFETAGATRLKRRGGGLRRASASDAYLPPLTGLFHGLRPLRIALDTTCEPLVRYFHALNAHGACQALRGRSIDSAVQAVGTDSSDGSFIERRVETVGCRVLAERAHFGLWVDGDGETCRLVDERGAPVDSEVLLLTLSEYICRERPGVSLFVEREASENLISALARAGARVVRGGDSRQDAYDAIVAGGAVFGGGASGRFWFAGDPPVADALMTLSVFLTLVSQSDRAVSEVLDSARLALYK